MVEVALNPHARQSELVFALEPGQDRLMKRYKAAQDALAAAKQQDDRKAIEAAQDTLSRH